MPFDDIVAVEVTLSGNDLAAVVLESGVRSLVPILANTSATPGSNVALSVLSFGSEQAVS